MHFHGYAWLGEKAVFDRDALRRVPDPPRPPVTAQDQELYRSLMEAFRRSELPPIEPARWLLKPAQSIRGTWAEAKDAAGWLGEQLAAYAPRFLSREEADPLRLTRLVGSAAETLTWGGDVSTGAYTDRTSFLSLALVACSPNRSVPDAPCPRTLEGR